MRIFLEFGDATNMVGMVMRYQNIGQGPAFALQGLDNGTCFRRVDRGGGPGDRIVNEIAEIIGQAGEQAISAAMMSPLIEDA
jgi:hypothetical protein